MTSRLDRLFVLLEAGIGPATRRAAARQLGEIQKAHPEELHRLLGRLVKHLRSPAWETRVAAAQAVEAILENVPEWHPPPFCGLKEETTDNEESTGRLRCETFDIEKVLQNGALLMGSEGNEYDMDEEALSSADISERLAKQRQQLNARLGLDVAANLGMDISSVYSNDDLCSARPQTNKTEGHRRPVQELMPVTSKQLSSREINVAKRKARAAFSKQKSRDCSEDKASPEPEVKKIKTEVTDDTAYLESAPVPDISGTWSDSATWPLEAWCGALQAQLFSAAWEARHGACSALRELLRSRVVGGAGTTARMTTQQREEAHQQWLEDMALRLLCVLALDRFGDFVSDQVVAPVRETCAQTLGVALSKLRRARVVWLARLVAALARQPVWEARHGALLAYKYLLHARQDVALESGAIEHLIAGLSDAAEDVSAVAAGALAPAAGALARAQAGVLPAVVSRLWQLLQEQDELAAPANSYMALLAALMAQPEAAELLHPIDLTDVLPRLWPFLDHSTSSVRKATLQTLRTLTRPLVRHKPKPQENGTTKENCQENDSKTEENLIQNCTGCDKDNVTSESQNSLQKSRDNQENNDKNCSEEQKEDKGESSKNVNEEVKERIEENGTEYLMWTPELLQDAMRHVYQRVLFEQVYEIQEIAIQVWNNLVAHAPLGCALLAACPWLARWLCAAMQPKGMPLDNSLLLTHTQEHRVKPGPADMPAECRPAQAHYLAGPEPRRPHSVARARCLAADMLGHLSCYLVQPAPGIVYKPEDESPIDCYVKLMLVYLRSGSALQRLVSGLVVGAWANKMREIKPSAGLTGEEANSSTSEANNTNIAPPLLVSTLHAALNQSLYYDEVALSCNRLLQEARDLLAMMKHYKLPVEGEEFNNMLRLEQVTHMCNVTQPMIATMKSKRVAQTLEERRKNLQTSVAQCSTEQASLNVSVQAALASACVALHALPDKLNPVIRPLMESIKKEPSLELQSNSAGTLARLLGQLIHREPCPNHKVLANLKAFLRCDPELTPRVDLDLSEETNGEGSSGDSGADGKLGDTDGAKVDKYAGILTLRWQQELAERAVPKRGRPPAAGADCKLLVEDEGRKALRIQRRGATLALTSLTKYFGEELPTKLPKLWEFISQPLNHEITDEELQAITHNTEAAEELISCLQITSVIAPSLPPGALAALLEGGCGACGGWARARLTAVRHAAARCLAALCAAAPHRALPRHAHQLIAALEDINSEAVRCGAVECLAHVVEALQLDIVPYIVILVVPLLGRISDPCEAVRLMATRCFATLIQLMPLDGAIPCSDQLPEDFIKRREVDKKFLKQLFNPALVPDYKVDVPLFASLRSYQQAGVNWLRFLYEYKLHGVLCDDMGLGKTLQSLCVMAGSHRERAARGQRNPSLVVCPPTLTGHWVFEVNKFIPTNFLKPLQYVGPPIERERLRTQVKHYNLIVASYDIVRKDIDFFSSIKWNYCVLDEGHVIKNGKTKAFKAIKQIVADHRLILSGTPIQNNVLELWSLFDFLLPGLLGTARQFAARYSRPILAAREPKPAPHALQAAALACEALHRQVLPFLLRRVKEDVLKELPPKITQDYYCDLSPVQRQLYEHFSKKHMPDDMSQNAHVFQALRYLQNVCNHPKLVLTGEHPSAAAVARALAAQGSTLDCIQHAAKLPALKQLLLDCGIGSSASDDAAVVSQHRALIFCQLKTMLDIVENDLLKKHLPSVTYLRLDGSVPPQQRHALVTRFNNDISIDVLLLTTAVGGLGLNLTGADTVIFVEHDWNPMKDLQAMDRAHRIGQKKVVNVYRLITRDTLEEKIMGLQKFKMQTANTVISSENAALETMGTDQLLDLFQLSSQHAAPRPGPSSGCALEALPELWDDKQYEEEYDMTNFIKGLNKMNQ